MVRVVEGPTDVVQPSNCDQSLDDGAWQRHQNPDPESDRAASLPECETYEFGSHPLRVPVPGSRRQFDTTRNIGSYERTHNARSRASAASAERLRVQGFNATPRRVLVMVISIRVFVEACR